MNGQVVLMKKIKTDLPADINMKNITQTGIIDGKELTLVRIHKVKARNLQKWKNKPVYMQSNKLQPFNDLGEFWQATEMDKEIDFDRQVNVFKFFYCNTNQTGYHITFYTTTPVK